MLDGRRQKGTMEGTREAQGTRRSCRRKVLDDGEPTRGGLLGGGKKNVQGNQLGAGRKQAAAAAAAAAGVDEVERWRAARKAQMLDAAEGKNDDGKKQEKQTERKEEQSSPGIATAGLTGTFRSRQLGWGMGGRRDGVLVGAYGGGGFLRWRHFTAGRPGRSPAGMLGCAVPAVWNAAEGTSLLHPTTSMYVYSAPSCHPTPSSVPASRSLNFHAP